MALSRCTQKGERIEGLSDDAEPTSNVAGACCLITADAMMTGSYLANFLGWDNRIFTSGRTGSGTRLGPPLPSGCQQEQLSLFECSPVHRAPGSDCQD